MGPQHPHSDPGVCPEPRVERTKVDQSGQRRKGALLWLAAVDRKPFRKRTDETTDENHKHQNQEQEKTADSMNNTVPLTKSWDGKKGRNENRRKKKEQKKTK